MSKERTFLIVIALILGIFALIIGGTWLYNQSQYRNYNDFRFEKNGELWVTTVQKGSQPYTIPFYYAPWELEDIVSDPDAEQILLQASVERQNKTVFITLDPSLKAKAVVAAVEISRITGDRYEMLNLPTRGALTRPAEGSANTQNPVVTCEDVSNQSIVLKLQLAQNNVIYEDNGCIILEGTDEENLLRVTDKFAYKLLGVMN